MTFELRAPLAPDHQEILHRIYTEAFPIDEQRPWPFILAPTHSAGPVLYGIYTADSTEPLGLVTLWFFDGFVYMEHFAIDPSRRSAGIGSAILKVIDARWPQPLVIEVEKPETGPQAQRRIAFYTRNGFSTVTTDYIQPPYAPDLQPVPLNIMSTHADACPTPTHIITTLHTQVYNTAPQC